MRKCSQPAHHALTELNITPLLDLGFVLLVIFIITTTPIVSDSDINLPADTRHPTAPPRKANFITLRTDGSLQINNQAADLSGLRDELAAMRLADPDLSIIVRADGQIPYQRVRSVLDACQQANVLKVDLATEASLH